MRTFKNKYNLAIVGMGRQGIVILTTLVPPQKDTLLHVIRVADPNPEAPGILCACRHNLFVTVDFKDLLQLPELDIIINATGGSEISHQLHKQSSGSIIVLSVDRPYSWENFWDLTKKTCFGVELELSVVYGIVRDHKGVIKVDSVLGQGTTFTIRLPAWLAGEKHGAKQTYQHPHSG